MDVKYIYGDLDVRYIWKYHECKEDTFPLADFIFFAS